MRKILSLLTIALLSTALFAACSSGGSGTAPSGNPIQGTVITKGPIGSGLTVTLSNDTGKFKNGEQEFNVAFTDASGKPVDVGAAAVNFFMPAMGSMAAMNDAATLTKTGTPGVYKAKVRLQMAGDWQAQISMEGPAGNGKASLPIVAQ